MQPRLEVITGPMFSGKTEELIRRLTRHKFARREVVIYKPDIDTRYSSGPEIEIVSHTGGHMLAEPTKVGGPLPFQPTVDMVVAFDEAQFFDQGWMMVQIPDLLDRGFYVIVAGLDMDYTGYPFGAMPTLMALADDVTKLSAVCVDCGEDASLTYRLHYADTGSQVQVGGGEAYVAKCRRCYGR